MSTGEALAVAARRLAAAGVEGPRAEARRLLEAATGLPRERLLVAPEASLGVETAGVFARLIERRAAREPLAYVFGRKEFYGREFTVVPGVLVPRPETETLVDVALAAFPDVSLPLRVLDLGVGTGCLLLTVLHLFPNARGVGTELAGAALACAAANASALGVAGQADLRRAAWAEGVEGPFDLILSNPPYIAESEIADLQPEVRDWEPRLALCGGPDGLDAYRALTPHLTRLLAPDSVALLEIGAGQEETLRAWFDRQGFAVRVWPDLAGIARCVELRPAGGPTPPPGAAAAR